MNFYFIKRGFINFLLSIIDWIIFKLLFKKSPAESNKKNVLIIKPDAIGDFLIWMNSAQHFRTIYPKNDYFITVLVNDQLKNLAEKTHSFDSVFGIDRLKFIKSIIYRYKKYKRLSEQMYDIIIYPTSSIEYCSGGSILKNINSEMKIGINSNYAIDSKFWTSNISKHLTKTIDISSDNYHELEKNFQFINSLSNVEFKISIDFFQKIQFPLYKINEKYIVVFPTARLQYRSWEKEKFIDLLNQISIEGIIIFCGAKSDYEICDFIIKNIASQKTLNLCGKTSLEDTLGIVQNAEFIIANESGGIHMAAVLNKPALCILGGGHYNRFVPYPISTKISVVDYKMECFGCDWRCKFKTKKNNPKPCIEKISTEMALNKLNELKIS